MLRLVTEMCTEMLAMYKLKMILLFILRTLNDISYNYATTVHPVCTPKLRLRIPNAVVPGLTGRLI